MNYLNYITKREYVNIYIILIYFFSILFLFIIKFSIPYYAKFFTFVTILTIFLIVFFGTFAGVLICDFVIPFYIYDFKKSFIIVIARIIVCFLSIVICYLIFAGLILAIQKIKE